jgi:hypothetical protein
MSDFFPFIYHPDKSIEVLEKTKIYFQNSPTLVNKIENLKWIYQSIGKVIPQTTENIFSGHFFPFTESMDELQISFNLVLFGFYKQGFVSLRSSLELGMLSVYYNINDDGHKAVQDWLKSKDSWEGNTPRSDKIWKILNSNKNICTFNNKFDLKKKFENLSFLHNYVHTKGYRYSNKCGLIKTNSQTFEENILLKWISAYEKIIILIVVLHMLKYPISIIEFDWHRKIGIDNYFPVLEVFEIERIREILPEEHFAEIKKIAANDDNTQKLFNYICELPDMTEEEQDLQIIKYDKMAIEHGEGFIKWEKDELNLMQRCSLDERKKLLEKIEIIRQWAVESDMMKPKIERLKEQGFFKTPPKHI